MRNEYRANVKNSRDEQILGMGKLSFGAALRRKLSSARSAANFF